MNRSLTELNTWMYLTGLRLCETFLLNRLMNFLLMSLIVDRFFKSQQQPALLASIHMNWIVLWSPLCNLHNIFLLLQDEVKSFVVNLTMLDIVKTSTQIKFKNQKNYPPSLFFNISKYAQLEKTDFKKKTTLPPEDYLRKGPK